MIGSGLSAFVLFTGHWQYAYSCCSVDHIISPSRALAADGPPWIGVSAPGDRLPRNFCCTVLVSIAWSSVNRWLGSRLGLPWLIFKYYARCRSHQTTRRSVLETSLVWTTTTGPAVPGPLSAWFHHNPQWFHVIETATNHVVEVVVPFFMLLGRPWMIASGIMQIGFQMILICSGY